MENLTNKVYNFNDLDTEEARSFLSDLTTPILSRKSWENFFHYSILNNNSLLHKESVGISFGAGREHLIYYMSNKVKKIYATDLYQKDTVWVGTANTDSPDKYVKTNPLLDFTDSALDVMYADMRDLSYFSDNYFDFAYSSCSISHIGYYNDFLQHLKEAYRVLKPGGVYVVTTEITESGKFIPTHGMHMFNIDILGKLVKESGFNTSEEFDFNVSSSLENMPMPLDSRHMNFTNEELFSYMQEKYPGYNVKEDYGRTLIYVDEVYNAVVFSLKKEAQTFESFKAINNVNKYPVSPDIYAHNVSLDPCGFNSGRCSWIKNNMVADEKSDEWLLFHTTFFAWGDNYKNIDINIKYPSSAPSSVYIELVSFSKEDTTHFPIKYKQKLHSDGDTLSHSFVAKCGLGNSCAVVGKYSNSQGWVPKKYNDKYYVDSISINLSPVEEIEQEIKDKFILDETNGHRYVLDDAYFLVDDIISSVYSWAVTDEL